MTRDMGSQIWLRNLHLATNITELHVKAILLSTIVAVEPRKIRSADSLRQCQLSHRGIRVAHHAATLLPLAHEHSRILFLVLLFFNADGGERVVRRQ